MAQIASPNINRALQERVQVALDRWIKPCYSRPYEHVTVRVNDCGEVWLSGLIADPDIVDEAVALAEEMPGVGRVFNRVVIMYSGTSLLV